MNQTYTDSAQFNYKPKDRVAWCHHSHTLTVSVSLNARDAWDSHSVTQASIHTFTEHLLRVRPWAVCCRHTKGAHIFWVPALGQALGWALFIYPYSMIKTVFDLRCVILETFGNKRYKNGLSKEKKKKNSEVHGGDKNACNNYHTWYMARKQCEHLMEQDDTC